MRSGLFATLVFFTALPLAAQLVGTQKVDVVVPMPPTLGIRIKELALVPPGDTYTTELHKILRRHIEASKLIRLKDDPALSRAQLSSLDEASRASLKAGLGSITVLSAIVKGAEANKTVQKGGDTHNGATYHAIMTVRYHLNVELLDLATGKITQLPPINLEATQQKDGFGFAPPFPDAEAVRAMATSQAAKRVLGLLLPWADHRSLPFFDDAAFGMKELFSLVKENKVADALAQGQATLAKVPVEAKPRDAARLNYEVGILQLMSGHYPEALKLLETAVAKDSDGVYRIGLNAALEAVKNQESIQKIMAP